MYPKRIWGQGRGTGIVGAWARCARACVSPVYLVHLPYKPNFLTNPEKVGTSFLPPGARQVHNFIFSQRVTSIAFSFNFLTHPNLFSYMQWLDFPLPCQSFIDCSFRSRLIQRVSWRRGSHWKMRSREPRWSFLYIAKAFSNYFCFRHCLFLNF